MENVHSAIAWYQKKIGSYDKQLWEQSVERKLQKGLPNVHHAPRKTVRLKTEYIDVDLIRGSTFTKTKPQVPWIYITRKAFVRVLFFPFYYKWWVHQTSWSVFLALLTLYTLQVITSVVYFRNVDGSIIEDELALTEVIVPMSLMFLLGLIHSQTVLAHFSLKPPRRDGRLRKTKKRARQNVVPSDQPPSGNKTQMDGSHSRERNGGLRVSPPRTTPVINAMWNVPRVEVSSAEQTSSQVSSLDVRSSLNCRSAARPRRQKMVRIVDNIQSFDFSTSRSSDVMLDLQDDSVAGYVSVEDLPTAGSSHGSLEEHEDVRRQEGRNPDQPHPSATNENDSRSEDGCRNNNSDVEGKRDTQEVEADSENQGNRGGCNVATSPGVEEAARSQKDTSDSDSVVGKFEFVNIDCKFAQASGEGKGLEQSRALGLNCRVVPLSAEHSQYKSSSSEFCDVTAVLDTEKGQCVTDSSVSEPKSCTSIQASEKDERVLGASSSGHVTAPDGSSNSDLESLPRILARACRGDRGSLSEDALDQKEEDNLSDTGHVSNSSNYNPSDSGPESDAEGDNLDDSLRLTIGKIVVTSASENPAAEVSSAHSSLVLGSSLPPSPALPSLTSSPRKVAQQQQGAEGESSASEPGSPEARLSPLGSGVRRRRRPSSNQTTGEQGEGQRARPLPPKLLGLRAQSRNTQTSGVSSSENEAGRLTPESANKAAISSEEWEDRMQSDMTTSSSYSTSNSESELSETENIQDDDEDPLGQEGLHGGVFHGINLLQPPTSNPANSHSVQPDKVSCVIWEGNECKKVDLTALDIGWAIIDKVDNLPESSDYIFIGLVLSVCLGCVPLAFRLYFAKDVPAFMSWPYVQWLWACFFASSWRQNLLIINGIIQRFMLSCIFFFLLTVTDRTFKQRLLYAKHFSYLTSSRRARKFDMPHFRLNKVRNIKIWLSLRSYLKRRGPQRSVDVIVSASFYSSISLICLMCIQMLKDSETYLDYLCNWELIVWCMALGIYIMRFMTLGLKINKKYRNLSVLITEQINLYLQMEQKPHKKEELTLANNVLRLAEDLLKELESPFKISGFSANPLIYNITKVVVLSAFSAVMTELLGFKLKLYKIKLKA